MMQRSKNTKPTEGELEIDAFMPASERDTIADWMREHPESTFTDTRANFGDTYSYGKLRMVQAWLKREGAEG